MQESAAQMQHANNPQTSLVKFVSLLPACTLIANFCFGFPADHWDEKLATCYNLSWNHLLLFLSNHNAAEVNYGNLITIIVCARQIG